MEVKFDFIIDDRNCEEATFDYYLDEFINVKSVTLKSILFYNSWWISDFLNSVFILLTFEENKIIEYNAQIKPKSDKRINLPLCMAYFGPVDDFSMLSKFCKGELVRFIEEKSNSSDIKLNKHLSISEFCVQWQNLINDAGIQHVKFNCDYNNYIVI
jgi:hypothetical protein